MTATRVWARLALAGALSAAFVHPAAPAAPSDPLTRSEFDEEISIDFKEANVVDVFRLFARATHLPFVLEFEKDPELLLTLKARNMSARAILASLASTYGLTYSMSNEGVVVRRTGGAPVVSPITVGAWPREAGVPYQLSFRIRHADGRVLSAPRVTARANQVAEIKQGLPSDGRVLWFDGERGLAEPRYLAGIEVRIYLKGETPEGLELLVELVTSRVIEPDRYVREHQVATRVVRNEEAVLFRTDEGHEIALTDWAAEGQPSGLEYIRKE
jgi:hypothetical protein